MHDPGGRGIDQVGAVAAQMLVQARGPGEVESVADFIVDPVALGAAAMNQSGVQAQLFGEGVDH